MHQNGDVVRVQFVNDRQSDLMSDVFRERDVQNVRPAVQAVVVVSSGGLRSFLVFIRVAWYSLAGGVRGVAREGVVSNGLRVRPLVRVVRE
jgi:hypothetical protein